jgi:hypothetical protein
VHDPFAVALHPDPALGPGPGVVQDWLQERELRGADVIRAPVALLVAAQLNADVIDRGLFEWAESPM